MKLLCTKFQVERTKNKVLRSQRLMTLSPATLTQVSVSRPRENEGKCGNLTRWDKCIQTEKNTRWESATSKLHQNCHRARFSDSRSNLRKRMDAKVIHALFLTHRTSNCIS